MLQDNGGNVPAAWSAGGSNSICWDPGHTESSLKQDLHRQKCSATEYPHPGDACLFLA